LSYLADTQTDRQSLAKTLPPCGGNYPSLYSEWICLCSVKSVWSISVVYLLLYRTHRRVSSVFDHRLCRNTSNLRTLHLCSMLAL